MTDKSLSEKRRAAGRKGGGTKTPKTKLRGFAAMTPEQRRAAGRKGGRQRPLKKGEMTYEAMESEGKPHL